ncbi:MAG: FAD-dependent oxidoreductase [Lentisphaeria bacterium]|nr:FAD-dependent oxidoreductase [Lentisphaeria bacterium]
MKINVPVIAEADVLIVGGSFDACKLAVRLRRRNLSVYCVTPYSYFGEDLCAALELKPEKIQRFSEFGLDVRNPNPAGIKQMLESVMISGGVEYLYENQPVAPMYDGAGNVCGRLFAGRSGFFAVAAKAVVDARRPVPADRRGACTVALNVIDAGMKFRRVEKSFRLESGSVAELSRIDLEMRTSAWTPETLRIADECIWEFERGGAAAVLPGVDAVAAKVRSSAPEKGWSFREKRNGSAFEAVSFDTLFRWRECPTIPFELNSLPFDGQYDVFVCGAGTGGAPAAIAAARSGVRTLCAEKLSMPGGICTAGRIASYWYGNCCGFTEEMDLGIGEMAPAEGYTPLKGHSPMERKIAWLNRELADSGCEVRFNTFTVGALREGHRVCGAILAGPWGVCLVGAQAGVDASGNADLAAAAGAPTRPLVEGEPAVQGAGLPPYELDKPCFNTDYLFVCDSDVVDATAAFTMAHEKFANQFDVAQILDTRERRRIAGEIELQPTDFFAHRQYHDTVVVARSNFDTHGFVCHPMFLLKPAGHQPYFANVPYRALLPKGWEGVLVTGLGISAHRDCMPLVRMQPDVQNQGYAAGLAAAMAVKEGRALRDIPIRELQKKLVECGILPPGVLEAGDSLEGFGENDSHLEIASAFMEPERAAGEALQRFSADSAPETAALLAFLGNDAGRGVLERAIAASPWDAGWSYRGMGQFGKSASPLDVQIMALSCIGGGEAAVLEKLETLSPASEFSHFRAVALYFIAHPCVAAAKELWRLLESKGFRGHAFRSMEDVQNGVRGSLVDTSVRNAQLKELYTARALEACDPDSTVAAEVLDSYRNSVQTYYALFASGEN